MVSWKDASRLSCDGTSVFPSACLLLTLMFCGSIFWQLEKLEGQNVDIRSMLGKLERMIWQVSQAKKTNADPLMNVLWCMRYGETGNHVVRGANPLSCYACEFHNQGCMGFENIRNKMVLVKDENDVTIETIQTEKNKDMGKKIVTEEIIESIENNECEFVCITQNGIPKKIFKKNKKNIQLFDEFSESRITNNNTLETDNVISVDDFIATLGDNTPSNQLDIEE